MNISQPQTAPISTMSWNEVLEKLIDIVTDPVSKAILGQKNENMNGLTRHCSHLLSRIIAEMVHQYKGDVSLYRVSKRKATGE